MGNSTIPETNTTAPLTTAATPTATTPKPTLSVFCQSLLLNTCPDDPSPICGTDLVSYDSLCEYSKARCLNPDLAVLQGGTCPTTTSTTTTTTTTTTAPSVDKIICRAFDDYDCFDDGVIICGSDAITYGNSCEFEKAKCLDESLILLHTGKC